MLFSTLSFLPFLLVTTTVTLAAPTALQDEEPDLTLTFAKRTTSSSITTTLYNAWNCEGKATVIKNTPFNQPLIAASYGTTFKSYKMNAATDNVFFSNGTTGQPCGGQMLQMYSSGPSCTNVAGACFLIGKTQV